MEFELTINSPKTPKPERPTITKDDLFGFNDERRGKYVLSTCDERKHIWPGIVDIKARVVIVPVQLASEAEYWLEYVYGGGCVLKTKRVQIDKEFEKISHLKPSHIKANKNGNYIAMYAQYNCW